MPALGMAQTTGKLVRWLKREGESVSKGEPLMEVETDKATVEVESPASGTLSSVAAAEGDDVEVGRPIALILAPGEAKREVAWPSEHAQAAVAAAPLTNQVHTGTAPRKGASPKARRIAAERGVDIAKVVGSGPDGAVVEDDLLQLAPAAPGEPAVWRAMAENVSRSWREAPHFFVIREVDASALIARRKAEAAQVTYTDILVKAVADSLGSHPRVNGMRQEINIGLAVAVPDGLIVPVIHNANTLDVAEIATRRSEVVERARQRKLRAADMAGATFTISNLGMYEVDLFTAILTEGQAGILATGRIADRAVAQHGEVRVRPTMLMSLSCDHRQVDGARAAEFLTTLVHLLEGG
jgi:pyruvate dehydrogenase E2 component (dihydrolipoamide acetyltransferase)